MACSCFVSGFVLQPVRVFSHRRESLAAGRSDVCNRQKVDEALATIDDSQTPDGASLAAAFMLG
jgi:hypothetical protein